MVSPKAETQVRAHATVSHAHVKRLGRAGPNHIYATRIFSLRSLIVTLRLPPTGQELDRVVVLVTGGR
jgi:hypothetical protein